MNLTIECKKHNVGLPAEYSLDENGKDLTIKVGECPACRQEPYEQAYKEGKLLGNNVNILI